MLLVLSSLLLWSVAATSESGLAYPIRLRNNNKKNRNWSNERKLQDETTNNSDDVFHRVVVQPFSFYLEQTPSTLDANALDILHNRLEYVVFQAVNASDNAVEAAYLGDYHTIEWKPNVTTLSIEFGAVNFVSAPTPDSVQSFVQAAVDNALVTALQNTSLSYITHAKYIVPNDDNNTPDNINNGAVADENAEKKNVGVIVGSIVAVLAALMIAAIFFVKYRKTGRQVVELDRSRASLAAPSGPVDGRFYEKDEEIDDQSDEKRSRDAANVSAIAAAANAATVSRIPPNLPKVSSEADSKSVAGSESDFTVNTEAGDSMVLKSIPLKQALIMPTHSTISKESFEREVNLRKDMLTSAWSGHMGTARASPIDSVLQPSHFVASKELSMIQSRSSDSSGEETPLEKKSVVFQSDEGDPVTMAQEEAKRRGELA